MRQRSIAAAALGVTILAVTARPSGAQENPKPTIAIADVAITPGGWTLPPPQLSGTIVELMLDELVTSERFHLYDGQWLVPESDAGFRTNLERLRAAAAERRVDYLVLGSLTAFSTEEKKKRFGGVIPTPFLIGGVTKDQAQLHVELRFRVVDVRTGEIVATATGEGIGIRRATGVAAGGFIGGAVPVPVGALAAARLPAARDAMLDEALRQAVRNAALSLSKKELPVTEHQ